MTNKGYVDSSRRIHSLQRQQDSLLTREHRTAPLNNDHSGTTNRKTLLSSSNDSDRPMVKDTDEHRKKEYDKQMRLIEVRCLQIYNDVQHRVR
jgi:hypothetical protein